MLSLPCHTCAVRMLLTVTLCLCGCTAPSDFDESKLKAIHSVALIDVSGELAGSEDKRLCSQHVHAYRKAIDEALKDSDLFAYTTSEQVAQTRNTAQTTLLPRPSRQQLLDTLQVDAVLEASISYKITSSSTGHSFNASPRAKLFAGNHDQPIWAYTGGSSQVLPKTLVVTKAASERLKGILKDAAEEALDPVEFDDDPTNRELATLMAEFHRQGALADWSASKISAELSHAIKVSRGQESHHFLALANGGTWSDFFEWKEMGASGLMLLVFTVMFVVVGVISTRLHPRKDPSAPPDPFAYEPTSDEDDPDQHSKAGAGCLGLISVIGFTYYAFHFLKAMF